jgi:hypothetical protein
VARLVEMTSPRRRLWRAVAGLLLLAGVAVLYAHRLPSALVGLTDIVLMYFVARWMFKREALAFVAAGMLALTPAHFMLSRYAADGAGVFTLPMAVLLVVGIGFAMRHRSAPNVIAVVGFFAASLAAVLAAKKSEVIFIATMLPFGVLLATMGVVALWRWPFLGRAHLVLMPAGLIVLVGGLIAAARSLLTVGHVTGSIGPVVLTGAALCTMAFASDAVSITKIIAVLLVLAIPVQFCVRLCP